MSERPDLIPAALDPARSVVVEACAGSGKTWLLVSRIVRLLLAGSQPGEILAITFTRKAAQEMEARLREWLEELAQADDARAAAFLRERAVPEADIPTLLPRARGLLEACLTAQPGLTVNTFHGWFLHLVQRAPLESGLASAAGLADRTSVLVEEAWQRFAEALQSTPEAPLARHLDTLFQELGLTGTRQLLEDFVARRAEWWAFTRGAQAPVEWALARLEEEAGLTLEDDPAAALLADPAFRDDAQSLLGLLERNGEGLKKDKERAAALAAALGEGQSSPARFARLCAALLTQKGDPFDRKPSAAQAGRLGGEAAEARLIELHYALAAHAQAVRDALAAQTMLRLNQAGLACGAALLEAYQALKTERQTQDFADVEWRASALLNHSDYAAYMQHRLDARYRHVLLDEFQDTNPLQWQALRAWLDASREAGTAPTVFLVGDPKQSIYRFRRAEPRLFALAARYLEERFGAARLEQNTSRRCAPAVLDAVNAALHTPDYVGFAPHAAHDAALPGLTALLPLAGEDDPAPEETPAPPGLRNPLLTPRPEPGSRREAEAARLAASLRATVGRVGIREGDRTRPARWRDVMLLVRSRTHVAAYEQALKEAGIPYLGTRRGGLLDTLEALDLAALLEFLVAPFADLPLAHVLRSPVGGCDDGDLLALTGDGEESAWSRLGRRVAEGTVSPALVRAHDLLARWMALADTLPVHDLLDRIYHEGDLPARYAAAVPPALRPAVAANLQAFMELALAVDGGRYPSLARFIRQLRELRRAPDEEAPDEGRVGDGTDAVRLHTIHEAKGLEAPIVWLLDSHATPRADGGCRALVDWPPEEEAPRHFSLLARPSEAPAMQRRHLEREKTEEAREGLNLLYVAMTRAKQVLIVSGSASGRSGETWHARLARALPVGEPTPDAFPALTAEQTEPEPPAAPETPPPPPLPGPVGRREPPVSDPARRRGVLLHALLEVLAPPARAHLPRLQERLGLGDEEFAALHAEAAVLLAAPELARFFDPAAYRRAWNELPCTLDGELKRMDRVVEFAEEVWVLDYKTGEVPAEGGPEQAARPYLEQMAEYRRALAAVFPGKTVRTALIFRGGMLYETC